MVETADRPGLLVDLVKIIADINITVESGEFETEVTLVVQSLFHARNHSSPDIFYLTGAIG